MSAQPCRQADGKLLIDVRLTPRGGRDALEGRQVLADGRTVLKARVRAAPEDGKANAALEALIAAALEVPRSAVSVVAGRSARLKTVAVEGGQAVAGAVGRLLAAAVLAVLALAAPPAAAQFGPRVDICADPLEFMRSRITVERSGLRNPDRSRLVRTLRAAQSLAEEGCPSRDGWLIRRAVGMLNAVNREIRRPPVDLPLFLRE